MDRDFPGGSVVKNLPAMWRRRRHRFISWVRKIPWRRKWQSTPVFLLEKSHGQRSLVVYSPWGYKDSDTTEQLSAHSLGDTQVVHIHCGVLAIKKNTFESILMRWMKLEPIIRSEVSQKEKHQYSILTHIYGI